MRISPMPLACCAIFISISLTVQAETQNDRDIHCAAYYELLSVAGDQPDISRKQSSRAFYALLVHAGNNQKAQDDVTQKLVELRREIPGQMTSANIAKLREKYDPECKVLLKAAWCEAYKDPGACEA